MNKLFVIFLLLVFFVEGLFSQQSAHVGGGRFILRKEYNLIDRGVTEDNNTYNLDSKSTIERILFGETNSMVEFVFENSSQETNASGLRIVKNLKQTSYRLEIASIPDSREMVHLLSKKENPVIIPGELMATTSLILKDLEIINEYNRNTMRSKMDGSLYKPFRPELKTFPVSNKFAEKLHETIVAVIDNFKAEGIPPVIVDGYLVTFRCVVGAEVWSLRIHIPQNKVLQLSDLCRQIITDIQADNYDEEKYLKLIERLNF